MFLERAEYEAGLASADARVRGSMEICLRAGLRAAMSESLRGRASLEEESSTIEELNLSLAKLGEQMKRLHRRRVALARRIQDLRTERDELVSGLERAQLPAGWGWSRKHMSEREIRALWLEAFDLAVRPPKK
ncbi:MAG TPA: hypothetical protein VHE56_12110 [Mycobacteriales bacterium]|nr:hypothetical protein [Mycobacteriales bacterium]